MSASPRERSPSPSDEDEGIDLRPGAGSPGDSSEEEATDSEEERAIRKGASPLRWRVSRGLALMRPLSPLARAMGGRNGVHGAAKSLRTSRAPAATLHGLVLGDSLSGVDL